jgi:hypothetical protein
MAREKYIESPEKLWELFEKYKQEVKNNPTIVKDWVGKDAEPVYREKERPLTMVGFECFVMNNTKITYPDLTDYFEGKIESYFNYLPISSRIRAEITNDQINGGMTMIYSQNLTARLNNLSDNTKNTIVTEQPLFPD